MVRKKVEAFMKQYKMLQQGDTVVVGVSGGADSVFLLWVLKELQKQYELNIVAVHVHHGIRGVEADEDELYVQSLCKQWDILIRCFHVDVPMLAKTENMTLEEAGRKSRYDIFSMVASEFTNLEKENQVKVAVAHHKDDNIETILMNLFRGSGLKGISGIEPVRGNIIRPLLCLKKIEIENSLKKNNIFWRLDATNLEEDYTRNKVRLKMLPFVVENFPQAEEHILQTAKIVSETEEFLKKLAYQFIDKYATLGYNEIVWDKEAFLQEDIVVQKSIVRQALLKSGMGLKDVTSTHIEDICMLAKKQVGKRIQLPYSWQAKVGYDTICICQDCDEEGPHSLNKKWKMDISVFPYSHTMNEAYVEHLKGNKKNVKFSENQYTKWFDYDTIKSEVVLRTRQTGDKIQVNPNGSKKLKDYMIDAKIPKEMRDTIPLVVSEHQVLWVVGYRTSEAFQVTTQTKNILQVTLFCEEEGGKKNGG